MREIITIHVGQAGIQLGNACWELFCLEHNIQPDGFKTSKELISGDDEEAFRTFFSETSIPNKFTARSIFIDLERDSLDCVRAGTYGELFPVDRMISGKEGAGSNFARGYCTAGKQSLDLCLDRIRKVAGQCQDLQGFIVFNSLGGGTGSGLGSLLLENLSAEYEKKPKVSIPIFPSAQGSTSTVEPYNTMLAMKYQMDHSDVTTVMENEALYGINKNHLKIEKPSYVNLNYVTAQMVSSLTAQMRFDGCMNENMAELQKNLVPYSSMHFAFSSFAPLIPEEAPYALNETEMTLKLLSAENMSIKCDPNEGKYMAANILYRGNYVPKNISIAFSTLKIRQLARFVDNCPTGWKLGICPSLFQKAKFGLNRKLLAFLQIHLLLLKCLLEMKKSLTKCIKTEHFFIAICQKGWKKKILWLRERS